VADDKQANLIRRDAFVEATRPPRRTPCVAVGEGARVTTWTKRWPAVIVDLDGKTVDAWRPREGGA